MKLRNVFTRSILLAALVGLPLFFASCDQIEKRLEGVIGKDTLLDQGYINFDDTGNITAVFNNLEFASNPMYSDVSFIAVYVFPRGADPGARCCSGSTCGVTEAASCLSGIGFSNDLGFAGTYYIDLHPPQPFPRFTSRYYMRVFAAGKDGLPDNYQGEYTDFSSPTGPVGDRAVFDLYVGVYYSVFAAGVSPHRLKNQSRTFGSNTVYLPVAPDFLSPKIEVEARFFPESEGDPSGSWFPIPHLSSWNRIPTIPTFDDFRGRVVINEVVYNPAYTGSTQGNSDNPEWIEIYNNSGQTLSMYGWQLASTSRPTLTLGVTAGTTFLATTAVPPGAKIIIAYFNSGQAPNSSAAPFNADDFDFSDNRAVIRIVDTDFTGLSIDSSVRFFQDTGNTMIDYVEWTDQPTASSCGDETGASTAAGSGIWTTGDCIKSAAGANWGIKRIPNGVDNNISTDWVLCTTSGCFTPGADNN